ncbi:MAG: DMT family transporter [Desulfovibrio sp.]|uniref:DMT family transporter n=1 Tax=Desulfovibrio sp. 7SRBS1 TaxID=3378064 RepID=UPI003B401803
MKQTTMVLEPDSATNNLGAAVSYLALLCAVLLWGASFSAMRLAVGVLSPSGVMGLRMWLGVLVLLPFAGRLYRQGRKAYRPGDWKLLAPAALLQSCLYFLLESNALQYTTSSQAGIIAASVPLLVAFGAALTLGERLTSRAMAGMVLSIGGVICLTLIGGKISGASNPVLGNTLEFGAMICASAQMLVVKKLSSRYTPWSLTALQTLAGAIFFLPGIVSVAHADPAVWDLRMIAIVIFLGGPVTIGAFGLYNWGLSRIPVGHASTFINLVPVAAVGFGWIVLGESLTMIQCLFGMLVFLGVWLAQSGGK